MGGAGFVGNVLMGVVFVFFFLGVVVLFYDADKFYGWVLLVVGFVFIVLEVVICFRFFMYIKLTYLLFMFVLMVVGLGMVFCSFKLGG